jgi:PilZ domain
MVAQNAEDRRSGRSKVFSTASVECDGLRTEAHVLNLSSHGVLVRCDRVLREAAPVTFQCHGLIVQGTVAWSDPGGTGINFNEPIQPVRLLRKGRGEEGSRG